ncbi:hypothetical protein G9A89_018666 [Geosiphon pyriformis]|nr:hypothetical protein G9A89_018666 [Geosiphon pyriformis]
MATSYIMQLTDFSGKEEETDMYTWLREAQKAIQTNNWNNQKAIQTLSFFLKGTANSWYQSLETKPTSFAEFKDAFLKGLKSSILGRVHPVYSNSLPEAITLARVLKSAKKEANHSQMVNIVMKKNKTETLEKRVTQLGEELSKKIEKEKETIFSGAVLDEEYPITFMYTEAKTGPPKNFLSTIMATIPEFQSHVATFKNPAPTKDPLSNSRKIQPYQPSKLISSCGLMTNEQNYQSYQLGEVKKDLNRTRQVHEETASNVDQN